MTRPDDDRAAPSALAYSLALLLTAGCALLAIWIPPWPVGTDTPTHIAHAALLAHPDRAAELLSRSFALTSQLFVVLAAPLTRLFELSVAARLALSGLLVVSMLCAWALGRSGGVQRPPGPFFAAVAGTSGFLAVMGFDNFSLGAALGCLLLPAARVSFTPDKVPELTTQFLAWAKAKGIKDDNGVHFSVIIAWAKEQGAELSLETIETLKLINEAVEKLKARPDEDALSRFDILPQFNFTKHMSADVEAERERKLKADLLEVEEVGVSRKEQNARQEKEQQDRQVVRSALNMRLPSKDSATVRDLELRLLTKNIAPDDYQEVLQFLAQIAEMQSQSVRCLHDSRR